MRKKRHNLRIVGLYRTDITEVDPRVGGLGIVYEQSRSKIKFGHISQENLSKFNVETCTF